MAKRTRKSTEKELSQLASKKKSNYLSRDKSGADDYNDEFASPGHLGTDWIPPSVALSNRDKSAQVRLSPDQLTCYGGDVRAFVILYYF